MKWAVRLVDEQASHLLEHGPARVRATHQQRHKPHGGSLAESFMAQLARSVSSKGKSSCSLCRWAGLSPTGTWACRDEGYPSCRLCWVVIVQVAIMSWFNGVHCKVVWNELCPVQGSRPLAHLQCLLILIVFVPWINRLLSLCNMSPSSGTLVEMMVVSKFSIMSKWVQLFTRLEVSNAHNMYSAKNTIYMLHTEDIQHQHANVNPFTNVTN